MTTFPIIISFDGNIGSGKSSIVKYLEENFNYFLANKYNKTLSICYLQEPVKCWESIIDNESNKNIIESYYENNTKYAFVFQMNAYISRLSQFMNVINQNYDIIITERSIYSDKNIFAKMLKDDNKLNSIEYQVYNMWFEHFIDILKNIKTVYIKTTPTKCLERIQKRNRKGENIPLDYLNNCHVYHENWLNNSNNSNNNVLIIDGDLENTDKNYIKIMNNLLTFIKLI